VSYLHCYLQALILRSRVAASRRMLQMVPESPEASFEMQPVGCSSG
jgi:hypothetical protein